MAIQKKKATQVVKKSATSAKTAIKKGAAAPKKNTMSKTASKKATAKTTVGKKALVGKNPKAGTSAKKTAKPIVKNSPVKKSAKPGVKKAAPKNLSNTKKAIAKKPVSQAKKATAPEKKSKVATKKQIPVKAKSTENKPAEKATKTPVVNINYHKKELKKALKKAKDNEVNKKSDKPFVMPKTNTEKSRKYEPQFVKSVLDQAPEENSGPSMRYSDNELNEFKELITRKLETAKKELGYLQGLITRKDEMGGDDTDNRYMTMEDGSLSMEREQLSQMASRQITFIDHLEKAMMRIENKTYGICRVTGKLIDKARLRAVPHATLSIEAKMGIAK